VELHSLLDADDYGIPHGGRGFRFNLPRHADMVGAQGVYPEEGFALSGGPRPGWFAISTARIHQRSGAYDYLLKYCTPVDRVGYSILIYRILPEEARRLQRLLIEPHLRAVLQEEQAERPPQRAAPPGFG